MCCPLLPILGIWGLVGGLIGDDPNGYSQTPLHVAILRGDVEMIRLLLECGADPDLPAFFWNCCCCRFTCMQLARKTSPADEITKLLRSAPARDGHDGV